MTLSLEAKVGAFTIGGLMLLAVAVAGLSGLSIGDNGYLVYAGFRQTNGLYPQSEVRLSGVPIGNVESIVNDGGGVTVALRIKDGVKIPQDAEVSIGSSGVMGDRFISVMPGKGEAPPLEDGDYVIGKDEQGMDALFEQMNKTVAQAQDILVSLNEIVGNPEVKTALIDTAVNLRDISGNIKGITAAAEDLAKDSRGDMRVIRQNLVGVTAHLDRTLASVEHTMKNIDSFAGDPQTAANLKLTLQNVTETSKSVERMAKNMEKVFGDEKTADDLKTTITNARKISEKAGKLTEAVENMEVTPSVDVLYSGEESHVKTNLNLEIEKEKRASLIMGLDDVGEKNKVNFEVGARRESIGGRVGVIYGSVGLGLDAYLGDKFKFSADAFDPNKTKLRLRAKYNVTGDTWLMGELNDVTQREKRSTYFGIQQQF